MKLIFMGTMRFAVPILEMLQEQAEIMLVVTQPDRPFGRKRELKASPVKEKAIELGIPVFQPESIRKEQNVILNMQPDVIVVAAYGQMIPNTILEHPTHGCINVHASLLPKLRGGAPMHKAIQQGFETTGVTVMKMAMKMDSGAVYATASTPIDDMDDVGSLEERLSHMGANLLKKVLPEILDGSLLPTPQEESEVTFAYNIKREEERVSFAGSARSVFNHVRGYHPWPLTDLEIDGQIIKLYRVSIVDETKVVSSHPGEIIGVGKDYVHIQANPGIVGLEYVQLQGKSPMEIRAFLAGSGKSLFRVGKIVNSL